MIHIRWLELARSFDGLSEIPGPASNDRIKRMWLSLKNGAWYWTHYGEDDSLLPWCGGAMAYVMQQCGISYPATYASARSWATWGSPLRDPVQGAIVVFSRQGGGHVGILEGIDQRGRYLIWGANQKDRVSLAPFEPWRAIAKRWPPGHDLPPNVAPPRIDSLVPASRNEA